MKERIHFHTNAPFFCGSENMLVTFLGSRILREKYDLSFSYRKSDSYERVLQERVSLEKLRLIPLDLPELTDFYKLLDPFGKSVTAAFIKMLMTILCLKQILIFINFLKLLRVFRSGKIDILHINNGGYPGSDACASAVLAARALGIKKIVYVVNNIAQGYERPSRWPDFLPDRLIRRFVTHFVTGSKCAGNALTRVLDLKKNKVIRIHNGISKREVTETREEVFRRLRIRSDRLIALIVALHEKRKGHIVYLQAIRHLLENGYERRLPFTIIEGTGSKSRALQEYVRANGLSEYFAFIGVEENIFNVMNVSDIIVLPSIFNEDFPNVIIEAMSLGKAVVSTRLAGIPEQVDDGVTGFLVPPSDFMSLAEKLGILTDHPGRITEMGSNGRRKYSECFTAEHAVSNYMRLYDRLLDSRQLEPVNQYNRNGEQI